MIIEYSFTGNCQTEDSHVHIWADSWLDVFRRVYKIESKENQYNRYLKFIEELCFLCGPCIDSVTYVKGACFRRVLRNHLPYIFLVSIDTNQNLPSQQ